VIVKPGVGHHPHSLKDPAPIVAFCSPTRRERRRRHRLTPLQLYFICPAVQLPLADRVIAA